MASQPTPPNVPLPWGVSMLTSFPIRVVSETPIQRGESWDFFNHSVAWKRDWMPPFSRNGNWPQTDIENIDEHGSIPRKILNYTDYTIICRFSRYYWRFWMNSFIDLVSMFFLAIFKFPFRKNIKKHRQNSTKRWGVCQLWADVGFQKQPWKICGQKLRLTFLKTQNDGPWFQGDSFEQRVIFGYVKFLGMLRNLSKIRGLNFFKSEVWKDERSSDGK